VKEEEKNKDQIDSIQFCIDNRLKMRLNKPLYLLYIGYCIKKYIVFFLLLTYFNLWRALYNYYKTSKGKVKLDNELSNEFKIQEGVKQGGILSPYLFNYFMNELLNENEINGYGAKIGRYNVSLISYCDDLIILSPSAIHANIILKVCK
jgi:hypothetical protein